MLLRFVEIDDDIVGYVDTIIVTLIGTAGNRDITHDYYFKELPRRLLYLLFPVNIMFPTFVLSTYIY